MNQAILKIFVFISFLSLASCKQSHDNARQDWLIDQSGFQAQIIEKNHDLVLSNGLATRVIRLGQNAATIELKNEVTGERFLRSIKPEAEISINDSVYAIGGLHGLHEHGYLKSDWIDELQSDPRAFQYDSHTITSISPRISWDRNKLYNTAAPQRAQGKELKMEYKHKDPSLEGVIVQVHYEIYDGLPLISKWISVVNSSDRALKITGFKNEILAMHEVENPVENPEQWRRPNIHIESDYAFGGFSAGSANATIFWEKDEEYSSQVNWKMETPCLLESKLTVGPNIMLASNEKFESFHTYELLLDGTDRERNSLSMRKMYKLLAPWSTENPIFMHLTTTDPSKVKSAIDQCKVTGYEMVILSFGSGLNMEDTTAANIHKFKDLAAYAHKKDIKLGGYSLFSSRKISEIYDVIDKNTGQPGGAKFGNAPCLASEWGYDYLEKIKYFLAETNFDLLEHDGPYPGDFCASTTHKYHMGYEDSQWKQYQMTIDFYHWLKEKNIYLNAPDFYYLQGSNKCGIGYREVNWSLPREQQIMLGRQNIYDGTWEKSPSMAWTFVPLTEYHGGGEAATLEPLKDHLDAYKAHMAQNYGAGVQACYRGPRLYDSEQTKKLVIAEINHYKKYRDILNADIIHLKRADGRSWDGFLHVNPDLTEKGFLMIFNPTNQTIKKNIEVPLYYTGLTDVATIAEKEGSSHEYPLDRNYTVKLQIEIPANNYSWFTIK